MAVEETRERQQMYNTFRSHIYLFLIVELIVSLPITTDNRMTGFILELITRFKVFNNVASCKLIELIYIGVTCIGTHPQRALKFSVKTMILYPIDIGITFIALYMILCKGVQGGVSFGFPTNHMLYTMASIIGTILLHQGLDGISCYYNYKLDEDRFSFENESSQQSEDLNENPYFINIPVIYYSRGRMHKGWIDVINPFRGTIVLDTPGSGKSFGIIDPSTHQHAAKGFAMTVYDCKFPTLGKTLFYQCCKSRRLGKLPENYGFHVINSTDVEYSNRINPIQRKYIPDLMAAAGTATTLLESLSKGSNKKGGSEAFFQNSVISFLSAIIYFLVNFRPTRFKDGKKLTRYIKHKGKKLRPMTKNWHDYRAVDKNDNMILDFVDKLSRDVSVDEDGMFVDLNNFIYISRSGQKVHVASSWYEDEQGQVVEPDTIAGEYSDMPHVLSLLGKQCSDVFGILMQDQKMLSFMAPFQSAYTNKAMNQLEGMVGTLRVNAARLVSPEAYWIFTEDNFNSKVSDPASPSYLVVADDPEKEQIVGALDALMFNRPVTRVNSRGNIPVSIVVDELLTLYLHKIDRLVGTARSNKVAVTLGLQELPQLEVGYGKNGMQKIITTYGNIFMGAAYNRGTLEWAQNGVLGKAEQMSKSITISDQKVSTSISERLGFLVPAIKVADTATGWPAGQSARDSTPTGDSIMQGFDIEKSEEFKISKYFCKTHFGMGRIKQGEDLYADLPKIYQFASNREKEIMLGRNFKRVNDEADAMITELLDRDGKDKQETNQ